MECTSPFTGEVIEYRHQCICDVKVLLVPKHCLISSASNVANPSTLCNVALVALPDPYEPCFYGVIHLFHRKSRFIPSCQIMGVVDGPITKPRQNLRLPQDKNLLYKRLYYLGKALVLPFDILQRKLGGGNMS